MTNRTRITIVIVAALIAALAVLAVAISQVRTTSDQALPSPGPPPPTNPESGLPTTTRDDTHVLGEPGDSGVTVVEFLDFECEACKAFYPWWEDLRIEFAGEVTFAIRYFPLPGHGNSVNAAVAVEAAARQDMLEPMYQRMFETQESWGERGNESQAHVFRQFAEELGLDMERFDADVLDPDVIARIDSDFEDGVALGVGGTPTFFVNDRRVDLRYYEDLEDAIRAELER